MWPQNFDTFRNKNLYSRVFRDLFCLFVHLYLGNFENVVVVAAADVVVVAVAVAVAAITVAIHLLFLLCRDKHCVFFNNI